MQLFSFFFAFFYHYLTTIKNNFLPLHIGITILRTKLHSYMKKKILILDDKETIAKVLSIYIRMPGMRGDDFLEWIKQNELFRHIPVIMLSSEDSTSERIRLLEIGAVDYIVKPFNPMELKIRVKKILPN